MQPLQIQGITKPIQMIVKNVPVIIPEALAEKIEEYWKQRTKKNPSLRRGEVYCAVKVEENCETTNIILHQTDYAHYLYSHCLEIEDRYACKNCWGGILIESKDNQYVIGQMAVDTSVPNQLQIIGGGIDKQDITNGKVDILGNCIRELKEELNIELTNKEEVEKVEEKYLKTGGEDHSISVIYKIYLTKTTKQVQTEYNKYVEECREKDEEIEIQKLFFIPKEKAKIKEFFKQNKYPVLECLEMLLLKDVEEV